MDDVIPLNITVVEAVIILHALDALGPEHSLEVMDLRRKINDVLESRLYSGEPIL